MFYIITLFLFLFYIKDKHTDLLVIGHQHQFDVFGLGQDVSLPLQTDQREDRRQTPTQQHVSSPSCCQHDRLPHPVCVCGAVDGGDSGVGNPAASSTVGLQRAGGEQQVDSSFFFISSSSSSAPSAPVSSTLPSLLLLPLVVGMGVVFLLRLQLKAQGGVDGDDAAAGGNTGSFTCYLQMISQAEGRFRLIMGYFLNLKPY